jgi:dTDP-4-amino-4,6-dideoxygalactose transaminase
MPKVPIVNLVKQYESLKEEIDEAISGVLKSGQFILGEEVQKFEEELARYTGAQHAIGVSNGTDALVLSLKSIGLGHGDEVITPAFSFFATVEAIAILGGKPVFVDIDPENFNINVEMIEDKITERTKAILPVHMYGNPVDMEPLMNIAKKHNLKVIEDNAQSLGARIGDRMVGTFGEMGIISFFPTKNLGAFGDGGAILSNEGNLAEEAELLRVHGAKKKYFHERIGFNHRLDTLQAAVLRVKLPHLENWNKKRQAIGEIYSEQLKGYVSIPTRQKGKSHIYHQYTIRTQRRDELKEFLHEKGVGSIIHYPKPLHFQPAFSYLSHKEGDFPESEKASHEVLSLPIYPELTDQEIEHVIQSVQEFFKD